MNEELKNILNKYLKTETFPLFLINVCLLYKEELELTNDHILFLYELLKRKGWFVEDKDFNTVSSTSIRRYRKYLIEKNYITSIEKCITLNSDSEKTISYRYDISGIFEKIDEIVKIEKFVDILSK